MVQNFKKILKSKISKKNSFLRHEVPFKAKNNREAVVVCAIHVVKRPSKRSVLVIIIPIVINIHVYRKKVDPLNLDTSFEQKSDYHINIFI